MVGNEDSSFWKDKSRLHLLTCAGGIVGSLMLYSVLQERIMTQPFGKDGELFKFSLLLVLCNRLVTSAAAGGAILWERGSLAPVAPVHAYAMVSLSNVIATTCQYEALKYVSFPLQTLGKCAKMIPVMVWSTVILGKRYKSADYVLAVNVSAGSVLFLLSGPVASSRARAGAQSTLYGVALMLLYLAFDGFTSTFQDRLFRGYSMSSSNQVLHTTLISSSFSLLGLLVSAQLGPALGFLAHHLESISSILLLSVSASAGQFIIVHTIRAYGGLTFATIMTTRQFLSILMSCALFAHPLTPGQWWGTAIILGSLYYKAYARQAMPPPAAHTAPATQPLLPPQVTASP